MRCESHAGRWQEAIGERRPDRKCSRVELADAIFDYLEIRHHARDLRGPIRENSVRYETLDR